jgi:hypothetical protein
VAFSKHVRSKYRSVSQEINGLTPESKNVAIMKILFIYFFGGGWNGLILALNNTKTKMVEPTVSFRRNEESQFAALCSLFMIFIPL